MVLKHKGYGAYIECGDAPLEEFAVTQEDEITTSCFVCSEAGKTFVIHYEDEGLLELSPGAASVQGKLSHDVTFYVDGRLARRRVGEHGDSDCSRGFKVAEDEISLFVFENTKSTDDENVSSTYHQDLGSIEVRIKRTLGHQPKDSKPSSFTQLKEVTVHEKSKKLSSHCVGGGTVVTRPKILTYYSVIEYDKTPHVKFRFYYRPRELLLARGIIQMPSAAKPVESKIPEIDNPKAVKREHESDDEEVQEIERRHTKAQIELAKAKLAVAQAIADDEKATLDQAKAKRAKKRVKRESAVPEVIDLC